jgi:hypothetical protein
LTECPATQGQAALPFVYTPPKTPGVTPHIGDALVICPIDTSLNIVWTDKMENIMNQRLLSDSKSGVQWCLLQNDAYNLPYRFEKAGYDPTMLIYHLLQDKYEVHGSVRLLPTSKTYTNEEFQLHLGPSDEGSIARAIDALGTLDWGDLPKNEIDIATANLPFCRAVAQYEAGQPITGWDTIFIGEPAQPMCSWTGGGKGVSLGEVDDQLTQYTGCSDDIQVYRLEPSGRLRIDGTVKDEKTGQIYKNPIFDKDGKVNSSDK